ncbi:uncharacterized protein LOC144166368 [Haemaphysalis longicornis]
MCGTLGGGGGDPDALSTTLASETEILTTGTLGGGTGDPDELSTTLASETENLTTATTEHNVACAPVEARLCASLAGGNGSGTARTKAFAWNTAQQQCTEVSSDTYCARTIAARSFFRDIKECSDRCTNSGQTTAGTGHEQSAPVTEIGAQESNPESETTTASEQTTAAGSEEATSTEMDAVPIARPAEPCVGVDPDAVDVGPCSEEDLRYPVYFDGTACSQEHERGKCRYHGRGASFETLAECQKACLDEEGKASGDDAAAGNLCKATEPTFECSDDLKKFSAAFDGDAGTCTALQVCLQGGYDTLEECSKNCGLAL